MILSSWALQTSPNANITELWQFFPDPDRDPERIPGSGRWSGSSPKLKIELVGPWAMPYPSKKFRQNPFTTFSVIRRTDRQTDKQTEPKTTSFGGGNYEELEGWLTIECARDLTERRGNAADDSATASNDTAHVVRDLYIHIHTSTTSSTNRIKKRLT